MNPRPLPPPRCAPSCARYVPMRGPRCAATIPGVEALTVIHYQRTSTPPRNARPRPSRFPRRRASHRLCRARRSTGGRRRRGCEASGAGSSKVITGNRHHAAASNLDNSVARLHHSTVHTGCATDHTCDVEIGPRYRLSQPMGTRMVTSHSWSAPTTCRPLTVCGNSRPRLSLAAVELFGRPLRVRSPPRRRRPRPRA